MFTQMIILFFEMTQYCISDEIILQYFLKIKEMKKECMLYRPITLS